MDDEEDSVSEAENESAIAPKDNQVIVESHCVPIAVDDEEASVNEEDHEEVHGIERKFVVADLTLVSKTKDAEIQEIEGESTSSYMV